MDNSAGDYDGAGYGDAAAVSGKMPLAIALTVAAVGCAAMVAAIAMTITEHNQNEGEVNHAIDCGSVRK